MVHAHLELCLELLTLVRRVYSHQGVVLTDPAEAVPVWEKGVDGGKAAGGACWLQPGACCQGGVTGLGQCFSKRSSGPAESAQPGNLLDQFPEPTSGPTESEAPGEGPVICFNKPSR